MMTPAFIGEAITPVEEMADLAAMRRGEPGFPKRFVWRDQQYELDHVVRTWKESGPCRHGSGEQYLRKHWFVVHTTTGEEMKVYFDRQPRPGQRKKRWWLVSMG